MNTPDSQSERRLALMLDSVSAPVVYLDPARRVTMANSAFTDWFGLSDATMLGLALGDIMGGEIDVAIDEKRETLAAGQTAEFDLWQQDRSGDRRCLRLRIMPDIVDDSGLRGFVVEMTDITERLEAADALRKSEQLFRGVFLNAAIGIDIVDRDGRFIAVNRTFSEMFGYSAEDLEKLTVFDITHPDDLVYSTEQLRALTEGTIDAYRFEKRYIRKDGSTFWADLAVSSIRDAEGRHEATIGAIANISDRKESEQALARAKDEWERTFDAVPDMISIQDTEFRIVRANKAVRDAFGLSADEIIGQRCHRFFHCTDSPPDHCPHARLLADGTCVESEFFEPHLNGYFNVRVRPVLNSQGEIAGCVHIAREVTERKRMEDDLARKVVELKKSNEESRALLAATRTLLEQHDFEESARRIFGITEDVTGAASGYVAMLSQDGVFNDLLYLDSGGMECTVDPSLPMPIRGLRADAYRTGKPVYENDFSSSQWVDLMPAGHVPLSNVLFAPLVIDSRAIGLLGLANKPGGFDEDDARIVAGFAEFAAIALRSSQAAEALRDSEERFRQLAENIGEGFWLTEPGNAWRLAYVSPALERMWGRGKQDFYATEDRGFQYLHSDHKDSAAEAYRVFLETLDEFSVEYRIIGADGALRWIWDRAFPVLDKHGKLHRVAGVTQDVTKRKIDQKRQEELIDEIKRFAYIISHDLRAPLVNLRGFSDELERAMEIVRPAIDAGLANLSEEMNQQVKRAVDGEIPESLQFIKSSVSRMDRLVSGILKLSRLGRSELAVEPLDMNRLATETLELFAHQISEKGIKVTVDYLPNVLADRTAMEQITANLLSNAINYLDPNRGGEIHLSGVRGETETVYHVRDNGIGVKEEDLDKVFEVFHRGDHEVPGEGMGLAYVRTLIRRHNGRIWCESTPGVGSVFSFAIPHHAPPEAD